MPSPGPDEQLRSDLLEQLRADQSMRWSRGERVRVESYLQQHPDLANDTETLIGLICAEVLLCLDDGDTPTLHEYLARFPQHADSLQRYWAVHGLHGDRRASDDPNATGPVQSTDPFSPLHGPVPLPSPAGYEMLQELGRGGMGVVYKARQTAFNRVVAIKMIRSPALAGPEDLARFRTEALAVGRLDHPHVVRVFAFGEEHDHPFIVMEHLPGGSLARLLRNGPLDPRRAAEVVRQIALGVQAAHAGGILHRDLKPGNVLLDAQDNVRVADFGLAKLLDGDGGQTASSAVLGTPAYMAPEQAAGRTRAIGPAADVWALGVLLYECLTGRAPFAGASREETLRLVQTATPVRPRKLRAEVPPELEAVCLKCLRKQPGKRYATAGEVSEDLRRWLAGEPSGPRLPSAAEQLLERLGARPAQAALLLLAVLLSLMLPGLQPASQPEDETSKLEQRLVRGRATELIAGQQGPRVSRWAIGQHLADVGKGDDGTFTVRTWGLALLELVRDPRRQSYRLRAQIRHLRGDLNGQIGFYVGHRRFDLPDRPVHLFTSITFDDVNDAGVEFDDMIRGLPPAAVAGMGPRPINAVVISPTMYAGHGWQEGNRLHAHTRRTRCFRAAGPQAGTWRPLTVEVSPDGIRAFVGQPPRPAGSYAAVDISGRVRNEMGRLYPHFLAGGARPEFDSRGGLGLLVERGVASFRNVGIDFLNDR